MLAQTERMRGDYPILALGGRPLHASEERDGWASIETYQKGDKAQALQEFAKCGAVILRIMEKIDKEISP